MNSILTRRECWYRLATYWICFILPVLSPLIQISCKNKITVAMYPIWFKSERNEAKGWTEPQDLNQNLVPSPHHHLTKDCKWLLLFHDPLYHQTDNWVNKSNMFIYTYVHTMSAWMHVCRCIMYTCKDVCMHVRICAHTWSRANYT